MPKIWIGIMLDPNLPCLFQFHKINIFNSHCHNICACDACITALFPFFFNIPVASHCLLNTTRYAENIKNVTLINVKYTKHAHWWPHSFREHIWRGSQQYYRRNSIKQKIYCNTITFGWWLIVQMLNNKYDAKKELNTTRM